VKPPGPSSACRRCQAARRLRRSEAGAGKRHPAATGATHPRVGRGDRQAVAYNVGSITRCGGVEATPRSGGRCPLWWWEAGGGPPSTTPSVVSLTLCGARELLFSVFQTASVATRVLGGRARSPPVYCRELTRSVVPRHRFLPTTRHRRTINRGSAAEWRGGDRRWRYRAAATPQTDHDAGDRAAYGRRLGVRLDAMRLAGAALVHREAVVARLWWAHALMSMTILGRARGFCRSRAVLFCTGGRGRRRGGKVTEVKAEKVMGSI